MPRRGSWGVGAGAEPDTGVAEVGRRRRSAALARVRFMATTRHERAGFPFAVRRDAGTSCWCSWESLLSLAAR